MSRLGGERSHKAVRATIGSLTPWRDDFLFVEKSPEVGWWGAGDIGDVADTALFLSSFLAWG